MKQALPIIMSLVLLFSCSNDKQEEGTNTPEHDRQVPVTFSSVKSQGEEVTTRATTTPLNKNFVVYGYKTTSNDYVQTVFDGYNVSFTSNSAGTSTENTHNYSYVGGTAVDGKTTQSIKYWDFSAKQYQYFAYTNGTPSATSTEAFTDAEGITFTFNGVDANNESTQPLFSELKNVSHADYGNVVQMVFLRPVSQVCYRFVVSDGIDANSVTVLSSSFAPTVGEEKIYTKGNVSINYKNDGMSFKSVGTVVLSETISGDTYTNQFTTPEQKYNVMPNVPNGLGAFKLTANIAGTEKTAIVPSQYMRWLPNYTYTYIFKIIDKSLTIVFVNVEVEEWQAGGYTESEQHHW